MRIAPILLTIVSMAFVPAGKAASLALDLGGQRFDPLQSQPEFAGGWDQRGSGAGLYLVQFEGPIQRAWLNSLRESGLRVIQYIHPYSYVVHGDGDMLAQLPAGLPLRWSGEFLPAYKVLPESRNLDDEVRPVMMLVVRQSDRRGLSEALAESRAVVARQVALDAQLDLLQLAIPGNRLLRMAQHRSVYAIQTIDQDAGPRGESSNQAVVGNYGPPPSNTIVPGYLDWLNATGYDGNGVTVGIVDGGVRTSHVDLADRMLPCVSAGLGTSTCTSSNDAHGTHVAGAVAGTGTTGTLLNGFLRGLGVAPGANLVQQRYPPFLGGGPGGMIADGMLTIYRESSLSGAVLTNNSWGPTGTPQGYDIPTQQVDMIVRDANPDMAGAQPVLPVWSIMNGNGDRNTGPCAPSSLGSPDEAKNLFAVGSTKLLSGGNQQAAIFDVSANSAHGNACDQRRVPHVVAPGCSTDSTTSSSNTAHSSSFCGTSMASPIVSGSVALFVEKYRDMHAGQTPSPALIKAAFTAVATDLEGFRNADNGVMGHRPDRFQGFGRLDLDAVMNPPQSVYYFDQGAVLGTSGEQWTVSLEADDPAEPVHLMLAWSDARGHGLGGTTPAWVNDLDLRVTADGNLFLGNQFGADGWSASGGDADERNNLEAVHLRADQHAGALLITVNGSNIAADALDPYTPGDPAQDFALVCYNCREATLGQADLQLALDAPATAVGAGEAVTISAEISNLGPDTVSAAAVSFALPDALSFVSGGLVSGVGDWSCVVNRLSVDCVMDSGMMALGESATIDVELMVSPIAPSGTVEISISTSASGYTDPQTGNNTQLVMLEIVGSAIFNDSFEQP